MHADDFLKPGPGAAKAVVAILRAVVLSPATRGVKISFRTAIWSERDITSALARMPKPVRCGAQVRDALLVLECEDASNSKPLPDWRDTSPVRQALLTTSSGGSTLLLAGRQRMTLSHATLRTLFDEYFICTPLSLAGDESTQAQRKRGISWVLYVHPPAETLESPRRLVDDGQVSRVIAREFRQVLLRKTR